MPPFDDLSFDTDDDFGLPPLRLGKKKQRAPSLTEPYDPQTQEGLLDNMLGKSMGFLQYLGETLDKPGRAVRGLLAGKPGELANLIPFSDTIGLTDPQQSVGGRDLLEQYGVLDANTPGLDWGDAAGFAADVLLDPTSYVGLGGLTAAGKTAQAGNKLTKGLGAGIRAGEKGLFDVGLPLGNLASKHLGMTALESVPVGTGKAAADFAENVGKIPGVVGDFTEKWIPRGKAIRSGVAKAGREFTRNFDPSVGGTGTELGQRKYREMVPGPTFERTVETTKPLFQHELELQASGDLLSDDHLRAMRDGLEGLHTPGQYAAIGKPELDAAAESVKQYRPLIDQMRNELQKLGIADDLSDKFIEMAPRYHHTDEFPKLIRGFTDALKKEGAAFGKGRLEYLKNLPDGTNQINDFFKDPDLWDLPTAKLAAEKLMLDHNVSDPEQALSIAQWVRRQDKAKYLTTTVDDAGVATTTWTGKNMFNASPVRDLILYSQRHAKKVNDGNFIHELAKTTAKVLSPEEIALNRQTGEWVNVKDVFEQAGLKSFKKKVPGVAAPIRYGAMPYLASNLGLDASKPFKSLKNHFIPADIAKDMIGVAQRWNAPETLQATTALYDAGLALFKGSSTQLWPGFHARNFLSGMYYNVVSGAADPSGQSLKAAYQLRMGQSLTPETLAHLGYATQEELIADLLATGVWRPGSTRTADALGVVGDAGGVMPPTVASAGQATNPLKEIKSGAKSIGTAATEGKGVLGKVGSVYESMLTAGGRVGSATEDILRINQFLSRKVQGWAADAAGLDVRKWLFNYDELTPFEKNVMKRAVPFYCVPDDSEILTRDGWKLYDDLIVGEDVMTYNVERDCMEWQPCKDKRIFDCDQEIMEFKSKLHSLRCTPEHKWACLQHYTPLNGRNRYLQRADKLNSTHDIIVSAPLETSTTESLLTPQQARLLGWLVTDGYHRWRGKHCEAMIYQHPKKFLREVSHVAGGNPRKPHPDTGVVCVPVRKERVNEIRQYLDKSKLCSVVTRLSRESAEAMYKAMYRADGTTIPHRTQDFFAATNPHVREAFRILAAMLGKRTVASAKGCTVSKYRVLQAKSLTPSRVHYSGRVWCPMTENQTWLMRQGGFITITGNTFMRFNTPMVLKELLKKPGGALGQSIRAANFARQDQGYLPEHIGEGLAIPFPGNPDRYITGVGLPFENLLPLKFAPSIDQTIRRSGESLLSQMTPAITAPYSMISGREPFFGRENKDLYPYPFPKGFPGGQTLNILANKVIGRPVTEVRKGFDERKSIGVKAANLFTGVKITDLSGGIERQKALEASRLLKDELDEAPGVKSTEHFYLDPANKGKPADSEAIKLLKLKRGLEKQGKAQAKKNRSPYEEILLGNL